jgi:hypothetical protein
MPILRRWDDCGEHTRPTVSGATLRQESRPARADGPHVPPDTWHAAGFDEDMILVETNLIAQG